MAFQHSPKIVTNGLVLALDAGNHMSYPGSGTTWTDLAESPITASLLNGTSFSSLNTGGLVFDGTNDAARVSSFSKDTNSDALSVFCWVYPTNLSNYSFDGVFFNWIINKRPIVSGPRDWQFFVSNSKLGVGIWNVSETVISDNHITLNGAYTVQLNQWQYVGFVTAGTSSGLLSTYYNANINQQTTLTGNRAKRTLDMDIGKAGWADNFFWTGNMSTISIYNRALTASEILQNYNATKGRFGL
jgi:hypothetical protein